MNPESKASSPTAEMGRELESPFTVRHVQTHLIFGPIARHVKISTLFLIAIPIVVIAGVLTILGWPNVCNVALFCLLGFLLLSRLTRQRQAILLWGAVKMGSGFAAFILLTVGSLSSREFDPPGALPLFLLGLIWLPGLEFIPRLTFHQKYLLWDSKGRMAFLE